MGEREAVFPQTASGSDSMIAVWQEYVSGSQSQIRLKYRLSTDGILWDEAKEIGNGFSYYWKNRVPIFSLTSDREGNYFVAVITDEFEVSIFKSDDNLTSFNRISLIRTPKAAIVPRLFARKGKGIILFLTQDEEDEDNVTSLTIAMTESEKGERWTDVTPFVSDETLKQNFLPAYVVHGEEEVVVFQSLYSGERNTYQLYRSIRSGDSWSTPEWISDIEEYNEAADDQSSQMYNNQRPFLFSWNDSLYVSWERAYIRQNQQIYLAELTDEGIVNSERISDGVTISAAPRLFVFENVLHALWFDNRDGNQVVLARQSGVVWQSDRLSYTVGDSSFPRVEQLGGETYLFWESNASGRENLILLKPDRSVDSPGIRTDFTPGVRYARDTVRFSWTEPADSSGIFGYSYTWSRIPDETPPDTQTPFPGRGPLYFEADEDGLWYFHLSALDFAGNWSDPIHIPFFRDTTPPGDVFFNEPASDSFGALLSNSFDLTWKIPEDEDLSGFSYRIQYLGSDLFNADFGKLETLVPGKAVQITEPVLRFRNSDNGLWAVIVSAIDGTGNRSRPSRLFIQLDKYIPVTYISSVSAEKDINEIVTLRLIGRGFSAGGNVTSLVLDLDGVAPWDYEYTVDTDFSVLSDRVIEGPLIEEIEEGIYKIGVIHPERGLVFARKQMEMEATGNVKFGDFSYRYESLWEPAFRDVFQLSINDVVRMLLFGICLAAAILAIFRLSGIVREIQEMDENVKAIMSGGLLVDDLNKEKLKAMKRRGIGLRFRFTFSILILVIAIILMISLFLATYMLDNQRNNLGISLRKLTEQQLDSLVSRAADYLPDQDSLELGLLPQQSEIMEEALYASITGGNRTNPEFNYRYVWGTNDDDDKRKRPLPDSFSSADFNALVLNNLSAESQAEIRSYYSEKESEFLLRAERGEEKRRAAELLVEAGYFSRFTPGVSVMEDEISGFVADLETEVNAEARELVDELVIQIKDITDQQLELALRRDDEARQMTEYLGESLRELNNDYEKFLSDVANRNIRSYPDFDIEHLTQGDNTTYLFYKPIVFKNIATEDESAGYYKGLVRLAVSTEALRAEIAATQRTIIQIVLITSSIAILIGFLGALFLARTMIRPIHKLVEGVKLIRDTQDKEKLKGHNIDVSTRDELSELAETINQMTHGLVEAAKASKDLTLGKEIQKMFIPLERAAIGKRKLTTGHREEQGAEFFGYYEGAKGVSGDYFDFRRIDDDYYALIKCDISGKGIPASLIMVEVATIFINYFKNFDINKQGIHLDQLVTSFNDLLEEVGFEGKFAALIVTLVNINTGKCYMCNAGDNLVHIFDGRKKEMFIKVINEVPAAGVFPSFMLTGDRGYKQVPHQLNKEDILFLFTDGIEEAQRRFRNEKFELIECDDSCLEEMHNDFSQFKKKDDSEEFRTHLSNTTFEEFGIPRIQWVIESVMKKKRFVLKKYHNPIPGEELVFDFSQGNGTLEEAVLGLISVEKIFRLNPDPSATEDDRIPIDSKVDDFLKKYFVQYRDFFRYPIISEEVPDIRHYTHLKEEEQFDDLTILAVRKK